MSKKHKPGLACTHTPSDKAKQAEHRKWKKQQARRYRAQLKKSKLQSKTFNKVKLFWNFFEFMHPSHVALAQFKIDKKGRPFFSIKFRTEHQSKTHVVKTACIWKDVKGNYRILMNVSRKYNFRLYDENKQFLGWREKTEHMSLDFLMKNQANFPVLIHNKVMIGFLPVDLNVMMDTIMDRALGFEIQGSEEEPF